MLVVVVTVVRCSSSCMVNQPRDRANALPRRARSDCEVGSLHASQLGRDGVFRGRGAARIRAHLKYVQYQGSSRSSTEEKCRPLHTVHSPLRAPPT